MHIRNTLLTTRLLARGLLASAALVLAPAALAQLASAPATYPFAPSKLIPGRYIVVFNASVKNSVQETDNVLRGLGGQLHHVYANAFNGFAATLPATALQALANNPNVDFIEEDQTVALTQTSPANQATWGLDRIDQADRPLSSQYYFNYTGTGVNAFIIDTGIRQDHVEFSGRLKPGYSVVQDTHGTNDCNGHGTHVAGTVGGTTWGVAKNVSLIPVRVMNCNGSGSTSGVIAGIDWVAGSPLRPAVANMSIGGNQSSALNAAVAGAVSKGITMVVAAGNSNANACSYSPSSEPSAITVGATTRDDARASYSNYGTCVDIFAPGSSITSAWNSSATATNTISGTSMAAPHVTGIAALALSADPTASPAAVASYLTSNATAGRLSALGSGSKNLLAFSLGTAAPQEPQKQIVAVKSLSGSSSRTLFIWQAKVTVTIRDIATSAVVANATVNGSFTPGGSSSCITNTTGSCTMGSSSMSTTTGSTTMTVNAVSGTNLSYDANQNSASQTTVYRP